ncbi:hypothetical protein BTO02_27875 [Paraburkholderia sp. SOS3]|nr:hypothetical protein BTO02_27875 [Paraburkholderia sp. SOS3]
MLKTDQDALLRANLRALNHAIRSRPGPHSTSRSLTTLMKHGGLYTILDKDMMTARLNALAAHTPEHGSALMALVPHLQSTAETFFTRLVPDAPYLIPSSLMSHIVLPHEGTTYSPDTEEKRDPAKFESRDIPAVFTFVGQFIDHDLTMNAVNLFEPQQDPLPPAKAGAPVTANSVVDGASPLIDLDSVYGTRVSSSSPAGDLYEGDKFRLVTSNGMTDLPREEDGTAVIGDSRNDENQLILQIHLLVQRMHNKFVDEGKSFAEARKETIYNWQLMILKDHLPRVIEADTLRYVLEQVALPDFGALKHKPVLDLATGQLKVSMPHEFAIGYRFGHSQLKRSYRLNSRHPDGTVLFDNSLVGTGPRGNEFDDLRGSQTLREKNTIEWPVFYARAKPVLGNRIDGKVTSRVFDLPESAIPDDIKYIGNLPHRNLIRSRQVGVCSGEALAAFYGITPFAPEAIEPDASARALYMQNEAVPAESRQFETPLWYYFLKEAELTNGPGVNSSKLGPLGSRLISEVIVGAIAYAPLSIMNDKTWTTTIPGDPADHLKNIIRWVNDLPAF